MYVFVWERKAVSVSHYEYIISMQTIEVLYVVSCYDIVWCHFMNTVYIMLYYACLYLGGGKFFHSIHHKDQAYIIKADVFCIYKI